MSTATRRIKELERVLKLQQEELHKANQVLSGLMEYAERAESLACAFAFDLQRDATLLSTPYVKTLPLAFEKARLEAGAFGKLFGGK